MPMRAMSANIAAVSIGLSGGIASALRLGLCGGGVPDCSLRMGQKTVLERQC
jgi:NH3-dependent NAD+ synthetase